MEIDGQSFFRCKALSFSNLALGNIKPGNLAAPASKLASDVSSPGSQI